MERCLGDIIVADFVSLDLEFSGLFTGNRKSASVDEYYQHCNESVSKFFALQLGVCCARFDKKQQTWILSPYNFYVFPAKRMIYSVDTTCLAWLHEQGFDLNRWITQGHDYDRLANVTCAYRKTSQAVKHRGLQKIIESIVQYEKPLVLHNGLLDLLHVYDKFIQDLPQSLTEFCSEIQRLFIGGIYDTKRIATESKLTAVMPTTPNVKSEGLAAYVKNFEGEASTSTPSTTPANVKFKGTSGTSLEALRLTLSAEVADDLKISVISTPTCSYDLDGKANVTDESTRPSKRARAKKDDPVQKEHEAGYDALLTMHVRKKVPP